MYEKRESVRERGREGETGREREGEREKQEHIPPEAADTVLIGLDGVPGFEPSAPCCNHE